MADRKRNESFELLLQNCRDLQHRLEEANAVIASLKRENAELASARDENAGKIKALEENYLALRQALAEKGGAEETESVEPPCENGGEDSHPQAKVKASASNPADAELPDELETAAVYIGRAVRSAADFCGGADDFPAENRRDIVNLALGRTEVFKSDVVSIMRSNISDEQRKSALEDYYADFSRYLDDLKLQK